MKRVLSFVLSLVITLGVITGMDVSVFATSETSKVELIDIDIYKAQCFLGIAEDTESNSDAVERCNSIYKQYIEEEALSPTQTFLDEAYADETLMAEFALWQMYSLGADSSTIVNVPVRKKDYYESLIMAIISQTLDEDSENKKALYIKAAGYATTMVDGLCNASGAASKVELLDKFPDVTASEAKVAIENLFDSNPQLGACDAIDIILGFSSNILDAIDRITAYNTMVSLDQYTKQWLDDMYYACDSDTDLALKDALFNLRHSSHSFADAVMVDIKDTSFRLANWSISTTVNTTLSLMAQSNPLTTAVLAGLKLGKTISDICFSASDVCEQFFMLECVYDIQSLSKKVVDSTKTNFLNSQTKENALTFIYAVDFCFESIINTDINCMISFLDTLYNGGHLKGLITWIYGATDDYQEAVSSLESLRKVRQDNYNFMIKCFKLVLGYNHWDTYEYYFVEDNTIPITGISFMTSRILPSPYPAGYADMIVGDFANIDVQYVPTNTTQKAYTATSDNPQVVEINNNIMTAVSVGTANVTITSVENPAVSYTAEIKVGEPLVEVDTYTKTTRFRYTIENNEITITGVVRGYEIETLNIPATISEYPVTKIADFAFLKNHSIKSVTIPSSVTEIGKYAFYKCSQLTQLDFSEGLISIGDGAFGHCSALTSAILPYTVKEIGLSSFENCTSLIRVQLSNNITELKDRTFYNCDSLEEITISKYITKFGKGIFGGCNSLKRVFIGTNKNESTYKQIYRTSADFNNIHSATVSNEVEIIDTMCFYGTDLYSVTIPDSIVTIGGYIGDSSDLKHIFYTGTESSWSTLISRSKQYGSNQTLNRIKNNSGIHYGASLQNNTIIKDEIYPTCIENGSNNIYCGICDELLGAETIPATGHVGIFVEKVLPTCKNQGYSKYYCVICEEEYKTDYVDVIQEHNYDENGVCSICDKNIHFDYYISNKEVTITGYKADKTALIVPSHIEFLPVKYIAENAFKDCSNVASVIIPDSVISIGYDAFYNCTNIISVSIPSSVNSIGSNAFYGCTNLESVRISDIAAWCNMDFVDIYSNPLYYADALYIDSFLAKDIVIPDGVEAIPVFAFSCSNITSVLIPDSVRSIERSAFSSCTNLTTIAIPDRVTSIGNYAFYNCINLKSVTIPDSVTSMGKSVFENCKTLSFAIIGDGVARIDDSAFAYCNSLTSITIGKGVTSIGDEAFYNCNSLISVDIKDIAVWCNMDFAYDSYSQSYTSNPLCYAKNLYINGELATDVVIPDGVTNISAYAFQYCTSLTSISIPDSVTNIGNYTFYSCKNLSTVVIGNSVNNIGAYAFAYCTSLESVTIPDSVTSISSWAFERCSSLSSVIIGNNVTYVGSNAFYGCSSIQSVILGESVTSIGSDAFHGCEKLSSINFPDSVTNLGSSAFYGCSNLLSVTLPNNLTKISDGLFQWCTKLISITIPDTVTSIGSSAFSYCSKLNSITIPNGVTSIGSSAFRGCSNLTTITIPDSVTSIGDFAFSECKSLTEVYITDIDVWCNIDFANDTANPLYYANDLYINGELAKDVVVPDGVEIIPVFAFSSSNITSVLIPGSVTKINTSAFDCCDNLKYVFYTGSEGDWKNINIDSSNSGLFNATIHYNSSGHTCGDWEIDVEPTCTENGLRHKECLVCGEVIESESIISQGHSWKNDICTICGFLKLDSIESEHPYGSNTDESWTIYREGAGSISVTFSKDTKTEFGYDFIYIYDGDNNQVGKYSGTQLAGQTITVNDDTVIIRLTSDSGSEYYGFEVVNIQYEIKCTHKWEKDSTNSVPATCTQSGAKAEICSICGETRKTEISATGHKSSSWITDKKATVNTTGKKHKECTECGEVLETAKIAQLKCSKPKLKEIENTSSGVKITWGKVSGADKYYVYRKTGSSGKYSKIATTTKTYYTDKKATSGKKYYYVVKAVNEAGSSDSSKSLSKLYLSDPTLKTLKSTKKGVKLEWSKVKGADGYVIYYKTGSGSYKKLTTVKGSSKITYTHTKAKKGKTYTYKVKAYYSKTYSAYSNAKKIKDKY